MKYDLIIIGSGPAGYVAAIRAGQTGLKTLVIDRKYVGGMCLNWGCIPTKTWMESAKMFRRLKNAADFGIEGISPEQLTFNWETARKRSKAVVNKLSKGIEYLWKKNAVEFLKADARIISAHEVEADNRILEADHIMIATGSRPPRLENIANVIELEDLANLEVLPERVVVYGHGPTVVEMAQFFALLEKQVTIVSTSETIIPDIDAYLQAHIQKRLKKDRIRVIPSSEAKFSENSIIHGEERIEFDAVLNCQWRQAIIPQNNLSLLTYGGYLQVDAEYRSSTPNIFAAGDVNGKSYLAHAASAQALQIVDLIHGKPISPEREQWPLNIYSEPEISQLGMTEQQLKDKGIDYKVSEYSLSANGKALAEGNSEGFIRLLYESKYSQVLGVQIVSVNATDMISEAAVLMELEGTVYDLARAVHAHPTVSEVFMDVGSAAEQASETTD